MTISVSGTVSCLNLLEVKNLSHHTDICPLKDFELVSISAARHGHCRNGNVSVDNFLVFSVKHQDWMNSQMKGQKVESTFENTSIYWLELEREISRLSRAGALR